MKSKLLLAAALATVLTACATGTEYKQLAASLPKPKEGQGRIYVYRNTTMAGIGVRPAVLFDGAEVGSAKPGGFFYIDAAAGSHELSAASEPNRKLTLAIGSGDTKYVKVSPVFGERMGSVDLNPVQEAQAMEDLPGLGFSGE